MKKMLIILLISVGLLVGLNGCDKSYSAYEEALKNEFTINELTEVATNYIFEKGCVRDKETAIAIATAIFKAVYGDNFNSHDLPLLVKYDRKTQCWQIRTQLPDNPLLNGGCCYMVLRKSNAEVVGIWRTK